MSVSVFTPTARGRWINRERALFCWSNSDILNVDLRSAEAHMLYDLCCYVKSIIRPFDLSEQNLIFSVALSYFRRAIKPVWFLISCQLWSVWIHARYNGSPQWPVFTAAKEIHRNFLYHFHSIFHHSFTRSACAKLTEIYLLSFELGPSGTVAKDMYHWK